MFNSYFKIYENKGIIKGPYRLVMKKNGNLILYGAKNSAIWQSKTKDKGVPPYRLTLSTLKLAIYDGNGK
jgi:hypothetical protein